MRYRWKKYCDDASRISEFVLREWCWHGHHLTWKLSFYYSAANTCVTLLHTHCSLYAFFCYNITVVHFYFCDSAIVWSFIVTHFENTSCISQECSYIILQLVFISKGWHVKLRYCIWLSLTQTLVFSVLLNGQNLLEIFSLCMMLTIGMVVWEQRPRTMFT